MDGPPGPRCAIFHEIPGRTSRVNAATRCAPPGARTRSGRGPDRRHVARRRARAGRAGAKCATRGRTCAQARSNADCRVNFAAPRGGRRRGLVEGHACPICSWKPGYQRGVVPSSSLRKRRPIRGRGCRLHPRPWPAAWPFPPGVRYAAARRTAARDGPSAIAGGSRRHWRPVALDRRQLAHERIRLGRRTDGHSPGWYLLGVPRSWRRFLLSGPVHPATRVGRCGSSAICLALPLSASLWSRSRGDDRQSRCGTLGWQNMGGTITAHGPSALARRRSGAFFGRPTGLSFWNE